MRRFTALLLAVMLISASMARADEIAVAAAANFTDAAKEIGAAWERKTGHKAVFSFGATGQLYTQISQGAPFDVFLSADQATVDRAVSAGLGVGESRFTYATGKLVLFSKDKALVTGQQTVTDGKFEKIAIANPEAAPYGAAALETMKALNVYDALRPKIVQGQNITQTFQFVDTGNAALGFVALSQVIARQDGSRWIVPADLYQPIKQDAVLTKRAENSAAAKDFMDFLKGAEAATVKAKYGYE